MWKKLNKNKTVSFIVLIIFVAIILGFILGLEFKSYKSININQNINVNSQDTIKDKININTASIKELMLLEGVGEIKAKKIIEHRPFKNTSELINLIGEKTYQNIKDEVEVK